MQVKLTASELIAFEEHIISLFEAKQIRHPIHIDNGNEEQVIEIFRNYIDEDDYIAGSWRSHYKCLLKGVPEDDLTKAIVEGHSICLCFPEHKIISSAIVGGALPIALGIAFSIKLKGDKNKVVCWLGDMTAETGVAHECIKYSINHDLPILWVIEDNHKSVCTDTRKTWGARLSYEPENYGGGVAKVHEKVLYYKYQSKYPHSGGSCRITF